MQDDEIEGAIRDGVGRVQDAYGGATGDLGVQARGKLNQAAGKVQKAYGQASERARGLASNADEFVAEQPYLAIGAAALFGLVVGLLMGNAGARTVYLRD